MAKLNNLKYFYEKIEELGKLLSIIGEEGLTLKRGAETAYLFNEDGQVIATFYYSGKVSLTNIGTHKISREEIYVLLMFLEFDQMTSNKADS